MALAQQGLHQKMPSMIDVRKPGEPFSSMCDIIDLGIIDGDNFCFKAKLPLAFDSPDPNTYKHIIEYSYQEKLEAYDITKAYVDDYIIMGCSLRER